GFNPNRVVFGPVERELAAFGVSPGQNPSTTWSGIPVGHFQAEAWLFSENGYRVGRFVWLGGIDIVAGEVTNLSGVNWYDESGFAISMPIRPITWVHNSQQPYFDGLAVDKWEITGMDALMCADGPAPLPSVRLVDRNSATHYYVGRDPNNRIAGTLVSPMFGTNLTALTTMSPWSHLMVYLGTNGQGIDQFGAGYPDLSTNFDGIRVIDLDGATNRVIALYQSVGHERYRVRVASTNPYRVEAEFQIRDLIGNPIAIESEPGLDRIWVGTEVGDLGCFDRSGNRIFLIPFI